MTMFYIGTVQVCLLVLSECSIYSVCHYYQCTGMLAFSMLFRLFEVSGSQLNSAMALVAMITSMKDSGYDWELLNLFAPAAVCAVLYRLVVRIDA